MDPVNRNRSNMNQDFHHKKFSILGDSISTLQGWNPEGHKIFYKDGKCNTLGIHGMEDTWWGKVIRHFNGTLVVNGSWSGSWVAKMPDHGELFPSGCSSERTGKLHTPSEEPDIILIYMGVNDWGFGAPVSMKGKSGFDPHVPGFVPGYKKGDEVCFNIAYAMMLGQIRENYPNVRVLCCTICKTACDSIPNFRFPETICGSHVEEFNDIIRTTGQEAGCEVLDLWATGGTYSTIDGTHPNAKGMEELGNLVIECMEKL